MRFSIKQVIVGLMVVSAFAMYAILDGLGVAAAFAILVLFAGISVGRIFRRWHEVKTLQRIYGTVVAIGSVFLLVAFIYVTATNATLSRNRTVHYLQRALAAQPEFENVTIEYHETKISCVYVSGTLATENDFELLKQRILNTDWRGMPSVRWRITISETGTIHDELDHDFFDFE